MAKQQNDIFTQNLDNLTTQFLNTEDESQRKEIKGKIELLQSLMVGSSPKKVKDLKAKKAYDISEVIGLGYGQQVSWKYRQYNGKELVNEVTALGEFVGLVNFQMNGYSTLGIAFKSIGNFADMVDGKIYGFKLESLREFKVIDR